MTLDSVVLCTTAIAGVSGLGVAARRIVRRVDEFLDDWRGTASRPGVDARPGVMERLGRIEDGQARVEARLDVIEHRSEQLVPNGGSSLRDDVRRLAAAYDTTTPRQ